MKDDLLKFDKRRIPGIRAKMSAAEFREAIADEKHLQKQIEEYMGWKYPDVRYIRIPDWAYAKLAKSKDPELRGIASLLKGIPDLIIFVKDERHNKALLMELKSKKGKLSVGQINWSKNLNLEIPRTFEKCEALLKEFIEEE